MSDEEDDESAVFELLRQAITATTASQCGWPNLATRAARECRRLAEQVVIELSAACARSTADAEMADAGTEPLDAALRRLYPRRVDDEPDEVESS